MEIANLILILLLFLLSLPCSLLLIMITENFTRFVTPIVQFYARAEFAWPSDSSFLGHHRRIITAHSSLSCIPLAEFNLQLSVMQYKHASEACKDQVECVFCLCDIEEGQEIRELRCKHLFHRTCLDKWLEHRGVTCPLCRDCLIPCKNKTDLTVSMDEEEFDDHALTLITYVHNGWWGR